MFMLVYNVLIEGTKHMRTNCITLRVTPELEALIIEYANEHKWTRSFAVNEILSQFFSKENRVS